MKDSWYTYLFMLVGGILFVLGAVFGTSCLYVIIPLALAISVLYWFIIRKRDNECSKSVASGLFAILAVTPLNKGRWVLTTTIDLEHEQPLLYLW